MCQKPFSFAFTLVVMWLLCAPGVASALDVTLDLNGFPNMRGGRVTGPALEEPIAIPAGEPRVRFENLQAGATYSVDFFHNGGALASDFRFTINESGTGIVSAQRTGERAPQVLEGFEPGDTTLTLLTHSIVFNANRGLSGQYFVSGLIEPYTLEADAGPQTWTVVPGRYAVDVLSNRGGGNEDWAFFVDSEGRVSALDELEENAQSGEYARFEDNRVLPRSTPVEFVIESDERVRIHGTNQLGEIAQDNGTITVTMPMTIGTGGVNVYTFGPSAVIESNAVMPDGQPMRGVEAENDFHFTPRLRYDADRGFYFVSEDGPAQTVFGTAEGLKDDEQSPLKVTVTATILEVPEDENDDDDEGETQDEAQADEQTADESAEPQD